MADSRSQASLESLLEHSEWIQKLARRLVVDESRANDAVQETWLAALRNPPASGMGIRGWLATVLRSKLYRDHRDQVRRERRESWSALKEKVEETPANVVEQVEAHRMVVQYALDICEPFRTTILMHFFRQMSQKEIASELGIPEATVRTRLHRGLSLLREKMKAEKGEEWVAALLPIFTDLKWFSALVTGGGAATVLSSLASIKVLCVVGAATVLLGFAVSELILDRSSEGEDRSPGEQHSPMASLHSDVEDDLSSGETIDGEEVSGLTSAERFDQEDRTSLIGQTKTPSPLTIEGRLIGVDRTKKWTTPVRLWVPGREAPWLAPVNDEGRFSFAFSNQKALESSFEDGWIELDDPAYCPQSLAAIRVKTDRREIEIPVTLAGIFRGTIHDSGGHPLVGIRVAAFHESDSDQISAASSDESVSDAQGQFRLRVADSGSYVVVAKPRISFPKPSSDQANHSPAPRFAIHSQRVSIHTGEESPLLAMVLASGESITGTLPVALSDLGRTIIVAERVLSESESEQANGLQLGDDQLLGLGGSVCIARSWGWGMPNGRFEIGGLNPGQYRLSLHACEKASVSLDARTLSEGLVTVPGPPVQCPSLHTLCDFHVMNGSAKASGATLSLRRHAEGSKGMAWMVDVDSEAHCRLLLSAGGTYEITPFAEGIACRSRLLTLSESMTRTIEVIQLVPDQAMGEIEFQLMEADPSVRRGWIRLTHSRHPEAHLQCLISFDEFGRGVLRGIPTGKTQVEVRLGADERGEGGFVLAHIEDVEVRDSSRAKCLIESQYGGRLHLLIKGDERSSLVSCDIFDEGGKKIDAFFHSMTPGRSTSIRSGDIPVNVDLRVEPALPSGRYRLSVRAKTEELREVWVDVREGETQFVSVDDSP